MEQTAVGFIRITCPCSEQLDEDQSLCLLRHKPKQILPLWIKQGQTLEFFINKRGLLSLQQLEKTSAHGQALKYLYRIVKAAYNACDHLLTVDLRLLTPNLIFFDQDNTDEPLIISLPIPENSDIKIDMDTEKHLPVPQNNLISWLATTNSWSDSMHKEIDRLFQDKRWTELIRYLKELINQENSLLAQFAARESLQQFTDEKNKQNNSIINLFKNSSRKRSNNNINLPNMRRGVPEIVNNKLRSTELKTKIQLKKLNKKPSKKANTISEKIKSWAQWLGLIKMDKQASEILDLEPTENLPNRTPNYRLATLSEGLPGTNMADDGLRVFILVDEFIIGRDSSHVDLFLDSPAVGRRHARIIRRGENFFIEDLGSINNTLLDGIRLEKYRETLLPDRCRLTFADKSFYFSTD
ncbi:MAG TPA: FHA domain-containing protein [Clostridiaceae bacterium]|nr:FHA domain-containing protein [Clostridiaceae bacterium]